MKRHLTISAAFLAYIVFTMSAFATPQEVARNLFPKTVLITVLDAAGRPLALGSGFVLKKGFVVSNHHVIDGASSGFAKRVDDGHTHRLLGIAAKDELRDIVILSVEGMEEDGGPLSTNQLPEVGETVFAIGNPRGLEGTFSQGIVSSIRQFDELTLLQITAPISPGSSGGPIADEKGLVIGVAVATFKGGQNLNFAVPVKYVTELRDKISSPQSFGQSPATAQGKDFFEKLQGGKSLDGLTAGSFLWSGSSPNATLGSDGAFSVSIKNNLDTAIKDTVVLLIFHDRSGDVVDFTSVHFRGTIPAGTAKRVTGDVDPSTKQLTTSISPNNQFMYADRPSTKIEYRTLGFTLDLD